MSSSPAGLARSASLYARSAARVFPRGGRRRGRRPEERLVFVVGSPRSGTTFVGDSLGSQPGFVDLDEVNPLKAAIPELARLPEEEAARRLRVIVERVRRLAVVRGLRGVEQTPETSFVLAAALRAYPQARAVHVVRDGRDVACSLLERGWLGAERAGGDDAGLAYGSHARFWVEPERVREFGAASEATRAAWVWRRYATAARAVPERTHVLRYEELVADPAGAAEHAAAFLGSGPAALAAAFARVHDRSIGRWRCDLTAEQVADVQREAGTLLLELGYTDG